MVAHSVCVSLRRVVFGNSRLMVYPLAPIGCPRGGEAYTLPRMVVKPILVTISLSKMRHSDLQYVA
jgi:hypothetical protein